MSSNPAGLPTCIAVRPELLVLAVRGALAGTSDDEAVVARAIRDHRDLLPERIRGQLIGSVRSWLAYDGARASAAQRAPWVVVLKELLRPTALETARARRAEWLRRELADRAAAGTRA